MPPGVLELAPGDQISLQGNGTEMQDAQDEPAPFYELKGAVNETGDAVDWATSVRFTYEEVDD